MFDEYQVIEDLRDAIRLIIGQDTHRPWRDVRQTEVDAWLEEIRRLKERSK